MRKRPNQDCIDILTDQRNAALERLADEKKKSSSLILISVMLACSMLIKPVFELISDYV